MAANSHANAEFWTVVVAAGAVVDGCVHAARPTMAKLESRDRIRERSMPCI